MFSLCHDVIAEFDYIFKTLTEINFWTLHRYSETVRRTWGWKCSVSVSFRTASETGDDSDWHFISLRE